MGKVWTGLIRLWAGKSGALNVVMKWLLKNMGDLLRTKWLLKNSSPLLCSSIG
jgi:hypothetical protein